MFQRKEQVKSPEINLHEMELRKISLVYLYVEISPSKRKKKVKQNKIQRYREYIGGCQRFWGVGEMCEVVQEI